MSYDWGKRAEPDNMTVDGADMKSTRNISDALNYFRQLDDSQYPLHSVYDLINPGSKALET